ncbi:MAG: archease [Ignisphaera sp.]|nr:archease [Ignisphaera sp.]MCX8167409.1 archease [Ignisphaera sp.]MDW8085935.1 archease [Ignisphaera sp.]
MEDSARGFKFLPHTADVMIKSWGNSLEEAFSTAAKALFEIITDTNSVAPSSEVDLKVCGYDLENLLYRWLEELLYYHDSRNMVFSKFQVEYIKEERSSDERQYCLYGRALGEEFNKDKHESRTVVKAITYHQMKIWMENNLYYLTVVVDI